MSNVYTAPSISGYNDTPPSDDGANTAANEVTWSGIKTKIGDPVKTYAAAISSAVSTAFGKIFFNAVSAESSDYTVVTGDRGKLLSCTGTITITLIAAATAGDGYVIGIKNSGSGVITVDGYSSETINGQTTYTLYAGDMLVVACDGSNWIGQSTGNSDGLAAASGYTRVTPNFCVKTATTANWAFTTSLSSGSNTIAAPTGAAYVRFKFHIVLSTGSSYSVAWVFARDSTQTYSYDRVQFDIAENALSGPEASGELLAPVSGGNVYLTYTYSGTQATVYYEMTEYYD